MADPSLIKEMEKRCADAKAIAPNEPNNPMQIVFDRDPAEYWPEETIQGKVILTMDKHCEVSKIMIKVNGNCRMHWGKGKDGFSESETYINEDIEVLEGPVQLQKGKQEFPFTYIVPPDVPSTFFDIFGNITYTMKGQCHIKEGNLNLSSIAAVIMNGKYDLNSDAHLNQKAELYDRKKVRCCCCCCKCGEVEILVKFHSRGFVAGDRITWQAEIKNSSCFGVKKVTCRLLQESIFHGKKENKEDIKILTIVNAGAIGKGKREVWDGYLQIPKDLPPTTLGGGTLIALNYVLKFEVEIRGCTKNMRSVIPIAIGTTPLAPRASSEDSAGDGTTKGSVFLFGKKQKSNPAIVLPGVPPV